MVKVLCVLTSHEKGFYLPEIAHPFFRFEKAGFEIKLCSINGGNPTLTPASIDLSDEENKRFFETPAIRALTENTLPLSSFSGSDFDLVFFVGGYGTMWDFPDSPDVIRITEEIYAKGGAIAAVCHGPIAFAHCKGPDGDFIIKGKNIAGFSSAEENVLGALETLPDCRGLGKSCEEVFIARGAKYSSAPAWQPHVQVDGTLFTGQNPASAAPLGDELVKYFATK